MVRLIVVAAGLFAVTLVVATTGAPSDVITAGETDVLQIEPSAEASGTYSQIDTESGQVRVILTEENPTLDANGVNADAQTDIGPVFNIRNVLERDTTANVWIKHDGKGVEFYADQCGTCIDSRGEAVTLQPGETVTVALLVDTRSVDEEVLLTGVTVMAHLEPSMNNGTGDTGSGPSQTTSPDTPTETPSDHPKGKSTLTPSVSGTSTPADSPSSSGTDLPAQADDTTSTPTNVPQEEAGLGSWLLGGLAAVVCLVGGILLTRRLGYV